MSADRVPGSLEEYQEAAQIAGELEAALLEAVKAGRGGEGLVRLEAHATAACAWRDFLFERWKHAAGVPDLALEKGHG
jgi:quinol monooxygenase YgiN